MSNVTIPDTPQTRTEQFLAAANGQEVALPTPMTREEIYLHEIATKMQGGGSSVTVEPLSVTENRTYTAETGKAFNPVTANVPSGGNPNSIKTISGTLNAPFGEYSVQEIIDGINSNSMTVILSVSLSGQTAVLTGAILGYLRFGLAIYGSDDWATVAEVSYYNSGSVYNAIYERNGTITNLKPMASQIATVLTIIHHPMSEGD